MSNILFKELPLAVEVAGVEFKVNTDFRCMARFENAMLKTNRRNTRQSSEIVAAALNDFYYGKIPYDINEAIMKLWWFYRCGEDIRSRSNSAGNSKTNEKRLYDYETDGGLIVSAFRSQYDIDLTTTKLHWWLFRSFFADLSEQCDFVKVMGYRSMDLREIKNIKERNRYKRLQEYYKLPVMHAPPMTKEERDAEFKRRMTGR